MLYVCSMITRKQALGFILLANFILLAHMAVPHHHHHLQICYAADSCTHHRPSDCHDAPNPDPAHPAHHHADNCFLGEFVPALQNHTFRLCHFAHLGHSTLHLPLFLLPANDSKGAVPFRIVQAEQWPVLTRLYTSVAHASLGLRAPPTV